MQFFFYTAAHNLKIETNTQWNEMDRQPEVNKNNFFYKISDWLCQNSCPNIEYEVEHIVEAQRAFARLFKKREKVKESATNF